MTGEPRALPREEWYDFFEWLTKEHEGAETTIEVVSREFGDQHEAERLPLVYLEYDPRKDTIIVAVGGRDGRYPVQLRHFIEHPKKVFVDQSLPGIAYAISVAGADGTQTVVTLYAGEGDEP